MYVRYVELDSDVVRRQARCHLAAKKAVLFGEYFDLKSDRFEDAVTFVTDLVHDVLTTVVDDTIALPPADAVMASWLTEAGRRG